MGSPSFFDYRLTKRLELFRLTRHFGQSSLRGRQQRKKGGGKVREKSA